MYRMYNVRINIISVLGFHQGSHSKGFTVLYTTYTVLYDNQGAFWVLGVLILHKSGQGTLPVLGPPVPVLYELVWP
jgi:hypothetical protein